MKAQLDWQAYRDLEFELQPKPQKKQKKPRSIRNGFHDIWQIALAHLKPSTEPSVWQTQDEAGQLAWSAYDPRTGKSIHQVSSDRVRDWLHL
jgi:hypothetical protein